MDGVPSVAVALLLVLAGCGGLTGSDDVEGRTVNPDLQEIPSATPSPSPTPTRPPGVSAAEVDAWILANAHHRALQRRGATVASNRTITAANGTTLATVVTTTERVGVRVQYASVVGGEAPMAVGVPTFGYSLWSDGNETAMRWTRPDGRVEYTYFTDAPPESFVGSRTGRDAVYRALADVNVTVVGTNVTDDGTQYVLSAEADRVERVGGPTLLNYSVVATVTEQGVVRSYRVRYEERRENVGVVTIRESFRVSRVGNTTVERPDWFGDAVNETEETRNGTETN